VFNRKLEALKVAERLNEPEFIARYPLATTVPPETARIDLLVADDRAMFPNA